VEYSVLMDKPLQAMNVTFLDIEDSANTLNRTVIRDTSRLFQILATLRRRKPSFCEFSGENGFKLTVGVGRFGCAQYSPADGSPPYLVALASNRESAKGYSEFFAGGTPTPVLNRYCMPFESVRDIAGYFLDSGGAHPAFTWEELSPDQTADA
jgi:hypothetical protein